MRTKKWLLVILSGLLVFASFPLTALANENTKDEVIYGKLEANGHPKNIYVVNSFHVMEPGEMVDYGQYTHVRNLTDLSDIEQTGADEVRFHAEEEEFYYQGELENQPLPWDISITYLLDGEEMNPDELAGKSGNLEIQLTTSANENVDPLFFENYLMQISMTLDPSIAGDIQAPEGTEANEGKNKQITFTVMPEQEEELIVSAHVLDFEMDPINITAMPANIAIEDPDLGNMTGEMQTLSDAIRDVNAGVAEMNRGISELNSGAADLSSGSGEYREGIQELDQSSAELVNGSEEILNVFQQVSQALEKNPDRPDLDVGDLVALPEGIRDMAQELQDFATVLHHLEEAMNNIPDEQMNDEQIEKVYAALKESGADEGVLEVVQQLEKAYHTAQAVKEINKGIPENFAQLITNMAHHFNTVAAGIENSMENLEQLDALVDLQKGLATLSSEYQSFHSGLVSYTEGVNSLATSYQELDHGIQELADGTSSLDNGASELHDGTKELQESTSDLPDQMQSEVDELMEEYDNPDFEPASFVSEHNENVEVVQFVLQTESIEVEEPEMTVEEEEEEKGFWDRLMDLFK